MFELFTAAVMAATVSGPSPCARWRRPVPGPVVARFAPSGRFGGHRGIDLAAPVGSPVRAVAPGVVTFAGIVVGNLTVTVDHGGLRSSYSFLRDVTVTPGDRVIAGEVVGHSGGHRGVDGLHLSARVGRRYVDPEPFFRCLGPPGDAVWLVPSRRPSTLAGVDPGPVRSRRPILPPMRGLLGGTFDPPHVAHLVAAEAAYRRLGLERVTFLPAGAPWQKAGRTVSSAEDRWAMTTLAIDGVDYFDADDREVRRPGWTFTVDTLESLDEPVVLILGADAARGLPTWHRAAEIRRRATIAVVPRPGIDRSEVEDAVGGEIVWLDMPPLAVSGTGLRAMVAGGKSIRFLVPDGVWRYVMDHGLYRPATRPAAEET